jgi:hypothetical protein
MWLSCPAYDLQPLHDVTNAYIISTCPRAFTTHDWVEDRADFWYPLLAFQDIEMELYSGRLRKVLWRSCAAREWAFGCFLWHIWWCRWAEIYRPDFIFDPRSTTSLTDLFKESPLTNS